MRRLFKLVGMCFLVFLMTGCQTESDSTKITVFAAKSLNTVMDELISVYCEENENVDFITNYDGSGTLQTQIEEGAECDIFFSAAQSQMNALEEKGLLVNNTRTDVVNNQVCVVTGKNSDTEVTGINDLSKAKSLALAGGSVPVGRYTRVALMNAGILENTDNPQDISTEIVSKALGNITINECANVGVVAVAVAEGANEVGTVYYSDYKGYENKMDIIEIIPYELTGNVIYPAAVINNNAANTNQKKIAADFIMFLKSDKAKEVFEKYYFDTNVK